MKYLHFVLLLLCLGLIACDDEESMVENYTLTSLHVEGYSFDPIPDGIQLAVDFESVGEDLDYKLQLHLHDNTYTTEGSYVLATTIKSMPLAAVQRETYSDSHNGVYSVESETYTFGGELLSVSFGTTDLTNDPASRPALTKSADGILYQEQEHAVQFGDDGVINYTIKSTWELE